MRNRLIKLKIPVSKTGFSGRNGKYNSWEIKDILQLPCTRKIDLVLNARIK
jgi:hypothetical protein